LDLFLWRNEDVLNSAWSYSPSEFCWKFNCDNHSWVSFYWIFLEHNEAPSVTLPNFVRCFLVVYLAYSSTLESVHPSETLGNFCKTTRPHIPNDSTFPMFVAVWRRTACCAVVQPVWSCRCCCLGERTDIHLVSRLCGRQTLRHVTKQTSQHKEMNVIHTLSQSSYTLIKGISIWLCFSLWFILQRWQNLEWLINNNLEGICKEADVV
jgi:hypothetical protein